MELQVYGGRKLGKFEFYVDRDNCFSPTTLTSFALDAIDPDTLGDTLLDLGCGIGIVGIMFSKYVKDVLGVDCVDKHIELSLENSGLHKTDNVAFIKSNIFEDVHKKDFNTIISDISGIDERVAKLAGWFPGKVPNGGIDGSETIVQATLDSVNYLQTGGQFISMVSSLSNVSAIQEAFDKTYPDWEILAEKVIPCSPELYEIEDYLLEKGYAEKKGSRLIWKGYLYKGIKK